MPISIQHIEQEMCIRDSSLIGGFDLALGEDEHLIGDIHAQVVVFRVGAGQLGEEASLAAAQFQHKGLLRAGVLTVPLAAPDQRLMHMEVGGHQLVVGIGFETHSHSLLFSLMLCDSFSRLWRQLPQRGSLWRRGKASRTAKASLIERGGIEQRWRKELFRLS